MASLVFESLYSAMAGGWSKEEINNIVRRLNKVDTNMKVEVFRSESVTRLFGKNEEEDFHKKGSAGVQKAMKGEEVLHIQFGETIDYCFPVFAQEECLKCHTNVKPGDVNGVIAISQPVTDLRV